MLLTHEILNSGMSTNGGWNKEQFSLIGIPWPPQKGWKSSVIMKNFPDETINLFLYFKDHHLRGNRESSPFSGSELANGLPQTH